jgi:hypothetical protein
MGGLLESCHQEAKARVVIFTTMFAILWPPELLFQDLTKEAQLRMRTSQIIDVRPRASTLQGS